MKSDDDLLAYLKAEYDEPRILRGQVLKYQKIEWDGAEYYLTSPTEMINAQQLWLPTKYMKLLYTMASKRRMAKADAGELEAGLDDLFAYLCDAIKKRYPRYKSSVYEKLMADKCQERFSKLSKEEKHAGVMELIAVLHCDGARGLKGLGLSSSGGRMTNINLGSSISDICFVDSSVTGMFERRSTIEP